MTKLKNPLLALSAIGRLGNAITFSRRGRRIIAETIAQPIDARSDLQLSWRHMYQKAVDLWHALSGEEKQEWESLARRRHMTGFAWFVSQCLKPNPGIYLPLQGGTMQGDIDMATHRLLDLPVPTADQEAATKKYVDDIPAGGYTQGARVYHTLNLIIPPTTYTDIPFNSETFDTDDIHDLVLNNDRLTCKTAGVYYIYFCGQWASNSVGWRRMNIRQNGTTSIAEVRLAGQAAGYTTINMSAIWKLEVGQFVNVRVYQTSGVDLELQSLSRYSPDFMMQRIG